MTKSVLPVLMSVVALSANAQTKGKMEVYDFQNFKLHVYYTNDTMGDASYIIETSDALITMEEPLFKDNIAEFNTYLKSLKKPVIQRISDYHVGGTAHHEVTMAEGMPAFVKGSVYGGMMLHFAQIFGDAITDLPTGQTKEVPFGETQTYAGVPFLFQHGATSDFPAASILIDGKVYYTHWTPSKSHISPLQLGSHAAIDAEIIETDNALQSGAQLFIGGHGGAASREAVEFKKNYLQTLKNLLSQYTTPSEWTEAMKQSFPNLPAEENLQGLADALYQ